MFVPMNSTTIRKNGYVCLMLLPLKSAMICKGGGLGGTNVRLKYEFFSQLQVKHWAICILHCRDAYLQNTTRACTQTHNERDTHKHTHRHTHAHTHTHTRARALSLSLSLSLVVFLSHTHTLPHARVLFPSHTNTHTNTHTHIWNIADHSLCGPALIRRLES